MALRLSAAERAAVTSYVAARKAHLDAGALKHLADEVVRWGSDIGPQPDLRTNVFARVVRDYDGLMPPAARTGAGAAAGTDEPVNLRAGEGYMLPYAAVRELLARGDVLLG
jgi:hypothetical protein